MPARANSRYLHGSQPTEQRRLSRLNILLNSACLRQLPLTPGHAILDIGSGLGQFTRDMARIAGPRGRVLGIERDPRQLAEARRQARRARETNLVEWRAGEAANLPLARSEWGRFDIAHARFVLEHVPNPHQVVTQMLRAVRPGGRIILADDDHDVLRLHPQPPGFADLWRAYIRAFEHLGCDPFIGRRLTTLLHAAGATPTRNSWLFFGSCAGSPDFLAFVANLVGIIQTARPLITGPLRFGVKPFNHALRAIRQWGRRPDAALWYSLCWAEGIRT